MHSPEKRIADLEFKLSLALIKIQALEARLETVKTDVTTLEDTARREVVKLDKNIRVVDSALGEVQEFIWPVVNKVFPNMLEEYARIGHLFQGADNASELDSRVIPSDKDQAA